MSFFNKNNQLINSKHTRTLLRVCFILLPWLMLFFVVNVIEKETLNSLVPHWNDELSYWHETLSFSQKGFETGYYTINELLPQQLSFGLHGFGTTSVYSFFALIFGWNFNSIPIANALFVSVSFLFLIILINPFAKKTFLLALFYSTFLPVILYSTTSMTELMNMSIILVYIILLYLHIYFPTKYKRLMYGLILFVIFVSFVRIIYVIFFVPLIITEFSKTSSKKKIILYVVGWFFISGAIFIINSLFVAPFPYSFLYKVSQSTSFVELFASFTHNILINTARFFYPFRDGIIQVSQRYFEVLFAIGLFYKSNIWSKKIEVNQLYFISFAILFLAIVINIVAYDVFAWRDYRVISAFVLGIGFLLILSEEWRTVNKLLKFNIITLLMLCFSTHTQQVFLYDKSRYEATSKLNLLEEIQYTENTKSKFENTLVLTEYDKNVFLQTPAGIGITVCDTISDKLKSKYIYSKKPLSLTSYILLYTSNNHYLYQKSTNAGRKY